MILKMNPMMDEPENQNDLQPKVSSGCKFMHDSPETFRNPVLFMIFSQSRSAFFSSLFSQKNQKGWNQGQ